MDHGNCNQSADCLYEQACPFQQIDLRLAYDDALPPRVQCGLKGSGDFALRSLLTFVAWHQSKGCLQCLSEDPRDRPEVGRAVSHHGPFLSCGGGSIAADQAAKLSYRLSRKGSSENYNSSQRASLAIDFRFGLFGVSPNLARGERNKKGEDDTQGRQQAGGDSLERPRPLAHGKDRYGDINCCRDQIGEAEN